MIGGNTQKIVRLNPIIGYLDSLRNSLNIDSRLNLSYLIIATVFGAIFLVASMRFIENNRMKAVFVS
jgi:ABC-type polysaccharide/polyol phosphate export permease